MSDGDDRMALIYQESVRALDQQQTVLDGLRTRAGVLIAAASVTTTFLSSQAAGSDGSWSCWGWSAVGCFVGVGLFSIAVLLPRRKWIFTHDVDELFDRYDNNPEWATLPGMHRRMADINRSSWTDNDDKLNRMHVAFSVACIFLIAEVGFWLIDVIG